MFQTGIDTNSQLCVFHQGQMVLDMHGASDPGFTADSQVCIFSSGKSLGALLMAIMRDQGHLKYHEKVS